MAYFFTSHSKPETNPFRNWDLQQKVAVCNDPNLASHTFFQDTIQFSPLPPLHKTSNILWSLNIAHSSMGWFSVGHSLDSSHTNVFCTSANLLSCQCFLLVSHYTCSGYIAIIIQQLSLLFLYIGVGNSGLGAKRNCPGHSIQDPPSPH